MNKIQAVMELYQEHFPDVELEQAGTWIRVYPGDGATPSTAYRTAELLEEIYDKTGTMYWYDPELQLLIVDTSYSNDPEAIWSTGDSWNTQGPIHTTEPATGKQILAAYEREEDCLFDDIGEV